MEFKEINQTFDNPFDFVLKKTTFYDMIESVRQGPNKWWVSTKKAMSCETLGFVWP